MGSCSSTHTPEINAYTPEIDKNIIAAKQIAMVMNGTGTKKQAENYAKSVGMDKNNTEALKVFVTQGASAGIKHLMTCPHTGEQLSYAESRSLYG